MNINRYSRPSEQQWESMTSLERFKYSSWLASRMFRTREHLQSICHSKYYMPAIEEYWSAELGEKMTPWNKKEVRLVTGGKSGPDREYLVEHCEAAVNYHRRLRGMDAIEFPETFLQ